MNTACCCWWTGSKPSRSSCTAFADRGGARDGDALREDIGEQRFSLFLYVITMLSLSAAVWMLVVYRRMAYGDDSVAEDQTKAVMAEMSEARRRFELADLPPPPA